MPKEPDIIFAVRRMDDGALWVDWHNSLHDVIDYNGRDTDKLIDMAAEFLEAAGESRVSD